MYITGSVYPIFDFLFASYICKISRFATKVPSSLLFSVTEYACKKFVVVSGSYSISKIAHGAFEDS